MSNIVTASFANGAVTTTTLTGLWQYDYGQILKIEGVDLPVAYEVHFCNAGDGATVTSIGDADGVVIPDQFLQNGKTIYAYIYLHTGADDGETEYKISIPVYDRAEPTDIEPTPQQESTIGQLISALNDGVDAADAAVEAAWEATSHYPYIDDDTHTWIVWNIDNEGWVDTGVSAEGAVPVVVSFSNDPYSVVKAAAESGRPVVCRYYNGNEYKFPLISKQSDNTFVFSGVHRSYNYTITVNDHNEWDIITDTPPQASILPPKSLGTASAGTSTAFSRGDHVHKMPSASDVGAIANPSGGSVGQVLKKTADGVEWADESGGGGGAVESVNGQTGAVVLDADDVGALPDDTTYVSSVNGSAGAVTVSVPSASSATPKALGTASAGSSADFSRADHVHAKPTYSKSDVGLGNVDNVQQYSATNPPPYPVTSVNSQTGDVSLSIPSTAGDVGAIPAPASPSDGDVLTYSGSAWAAAAPVHELPAGGNSGAVLAKNGSTDYSVYWRSISDYTAAGIVITAAATAAKVCQYSFWDDTHYPQILYVTLASANTAASALTMKVNGKGPYPIYINGAASSATNYTLPAGAYVVMFDGTNFYFQTDGKIPAAATDPQKVTISTAGAVTQALDAGKLYHFTGALTSLTITLNAASTGQLAEYHFDFDSGSTAPTVTLPGTVNMQGGTFSPEANKHYEIDVLNNYGVSMAW